MNDIFARIHRFSGEFLEEIHNVYTKCQSVENILKWFEKLDSLSKAIEAKKGTYQQIESHIFELKVINYIHTISPDSRIIYEPQGIKPSGKNCDLLVARKKKYLVELKTFHPENMEAKIPYKHVNDDNVLIMDPYSYHDYQATRGHLIDEAFDIEEKIANYEHDCINVMGVSLDFYLELEDLRDFIAIYRYEKHRYDDPLGKVTMYNLKNKYRRTINEFWGFPFLQSGFSFETNEAAVSVAPWISDDQKIEII